MAYDTTAVPVARSQEAIRSLIYAHQGTGVCIISQRPQEGFEALVTILEMPYRIRVMAKCCEQDKRGRKVDQPQEERRVWRVLYWHLKAMFEAADSGVIDIRDVIMPYVVMRDGQTLSDHVKPQMEKIMTNDPARLLTSGGNA